MLSAHMGGAHLTLRTDPEDEFPREKPQRSPLAQTLLKGSMSFTMRVSISHPGPSTTRSSSSVHGMWQRDGQIYPPQSLKRIMAAQIEGSGPTKHDFLVIPFRLL